MHDMFYAVYCSKKKMRYTGLLALLFVLTITDSKSQVLLKGSWMLGGSIAAENLEQPDGIIGGFVSTSTKLRSIAVQPQIAYFLANQVATGLRLYAGGETQTIIQTIQGTSQSFSIGYDALGIGGFIKIYQPLGSRFFFDLEIGGNYMVAPRSKRQFDPVTNEPFDARASELYANPGISFFFNSRWVLQSYFASVYLRNVDATYSTLLPETGSGYGLLFGPQAMVFRLNYFFGKED